MLILTKPLGSGIVSTAIKHEQAPADVVAAAVASMRTLNRLAAEVLRRTAPDGVHACTDITGFGLVGHAAEVAAASGVVLEVRAGALPVLPGALALSVGYRAGGAATSEAHFGPRVSLPEGLAAATRAILYDPQTSGGLLAAVDPSLAPAALAALLAAGVPAVRIGRGRAAAAGPSTLIEVR